VIPRPGAVFSVDREALRSGAGLATPRVAAVIWAAVRLMMKRSISVPFSATARTVNVVVRPGCAGSTSTARNEYPV